MQRYLRVSIRILGNILGYFAMRIGYDERKPVIMLIQTLP
jgi:hypothetical protein